MFCFDKEMIGHQQCANETRSFYYMTSLPADEKNNIISFNVVPKQSKNILTNRKK